MAFDVTGLTDYTDEYKHKLIGKIVATGKSMLYLDLQTGYKGPEAINRMDTDAVFQDGTGCGFNASGTTTLDQRVLTPGYIKVQENLCVRDLNKKWTKHDLAPGSSDDKVPFEEFYTNLKIKKIKAANEVAIWQGDTASGTANLARFDGLIKIIDAASGVVDGNTGSETSITASNVVAIVKAMYKAIPADLLDSNEGNFSDGDSVDGLAVMCGTDTFRLYVDALTEANLYHYDGKPMNLEIMIPGTAVKLIGFTGLNGTNRLFAGRIGPEGDFVVGTDLEHEEEEFDMWYSKDDDVVKFSARYKLGTQIKWPTQIVEFTLTA